PPPAANAVIPAWEWVHQVVFVTTPMPLTNTDTSTQTSGISAISTDAVTSTVAMWLTALRRRLTGWNVVGLTGASSSAVVVGVAISGFLSRPPRRAPASSPRRSG